MRRATAFTPFLSAAALLAASCATPKAASYAAPELAADAIVAALRAGDLERAHEILGPGAHDALHSGDPVADQLGVQEFLAAYDERHRLVPDPRGGMTLLIGRDDWPVPIPIVNDGLGWSFDTEAGLDELLSRRIGRNELNAIQVCLAFTDAQREYAATDPDGDGLPQYAQKLVSDSGCKNGLFWPTKEDEPPSPIGPLAAVASEEGYASARGGPGELRPFHGYFFRLLHSQGPDAPGGALDYVVSGHMLGGFALIAYPAEYGNSGIATFLVSHAGIVYERDLGPDTARVAKATTTFDPGPGWKKVD